MSIVTRGLGSPGGLIVTTGIGIFPTQIDDGSGGGSSGRYQVSSPKLYMRPKKPLPVFWTPEGEPVKIPYEIEIKTDQATYPVSFEAIPTVSQAIHADQDFKAKVERAAKELGISKRKARSALRSRVVKELRGIRALHDLYLDDDDIIEILIMAGVI